MDIQKKIQEGAKEYLDYIESVSNHPLNEMTRETLELMFKYGSDLVIKLLLPDIESVTRWRKVSDELPETCLWLLDYHIPDVKCTKSVLVRTKSGHIYENRRIKMAVGEKEWKWNMDVEGDDDFVEWRPIESQYLIEILPQLFNYSAIEKS